jgi:uncharacterized membrane protein YqjE
MNTSADRPLSAILGDIVGNVQQIVRAEIRLAKVELRDEAAKAKRGAFLLAGGALLGVLALGVLLLAAVYALSTIVAPALAALIVGVVAAVVAGAAAAAGAKQFRRVNLPPPKTSASVQETIQWAKTQAR